jgi:hypothetical protein
VYVADGTAQANFEFTEPGRRLVAEYSVRFVNFLSKEDGNLPIPLLFFFFSLRLENCDFSLFFF